ncbi:MAG: HEAT repeat domain-containing protein, partial [Lentisphaeria bacterium]|nr:HEAT repeat domain-containing protein [Lentisphaeria bacterium]
TEARMVLYNAVLRAGAQPDLRERLATAFREALAGDRPEPLKAYLLDQLQYIAGNDCLAAVAPLLRQPGLCDGAARVLTAVGTPEAGAVLARALPGSAGAVRLSLIQALARVPHPEAVPELLAAARGEDGDLRLGALRALAAVADPGMGTVLLDAARQGKGYSGARAVDAFFAFLGKRVRAGQGAEAVALALGLTEQRPEDAHIRAAAMEVCGAAGGERAVRAVLEALGSPSPRVRRSAGRALQALPVAETTPGLTAMLEKAPPEQRSEVLALLGELGARGALAAVRRQVQAEDAGTRAAAVAAWGAIAGPESLEDLVALLTDRREGVAEAAGRALGAMSDPGVGGRLAELARVAQPAAAAAILGTLARRLDTGGADAVAGFLTAANADVRRAALEALAVLGGPGQMRPIAARAAGGSEAGELKAAQTAMIAIARRSARPEVTGPVVIEALGQARGPARSALVGVLPAVAGPQALATATACLRDPDGEVRTAAVRALADWPDAGALPALLEVVTESDVETHYVLAFRGTMRLLRGEDGPPDAQLRAYSRAMELARRPDERKLVVAGMGTMQDGSVLPVLTGYLDDADLRAEAAAAITQVALTVRGDAGVAALRRLLARVTDEAALERARGALADIDKYAGCVVLWSVSGPYTEGNRGHTEIYAVAFAPEKDPGSATWSRVAGAKDGRVDLLEVLGGSNRCAYMRCGIRVPKATEALLEVGSDDGVKAWLNGKVVHENNVPRAFTWCEDSVKVSLDAGDNVLLLKVTQGGGDWAANARIRALDKTPLEGLELTAGPR